jgi:gliding motility-associated-like protein
MKNSILIAILICTPLINYSQLSANFQADMTQGCNSMVVHFENLSQPETGLTYFWDFGNGFTSTLSEPVSAYMNTGSYSVKLIVNDGMNTDTIIKENYIHVFANPQAEIIVNDNLTGCVPFSVHFIDNSQIGDGEIISRFWDFGDGIVSSEQNPTHMYEYQSEFMVSLVVTDENNCTGITVYGNNITTYKPVSDFIAEPRNSCMHEMEVNFYNNSEGDGDLSYQWDFGDGSVSDEIHPVHTYTLNDNFDVKLITYDEHGCSDTLIKNDYIHLSGVNSIFTIEKNILCIGENSKIENLSVNASSYSWDFGDGFHSTAVNPVHSYSQAGNYSITLTAFHALGCTDSISIPVIVEGVTADFSLSDEFSCSVPVTVQYHNLSQNAVAYEWHFGNGQISNEFEPEVVYTKKGVYVDTLIAYSTHGCSSKKVLNPSFTVVLPTAYFTPNQWNEPDKIKGCAPLTVNFHNQSVYATEYDEIESYYWNFGDGNTSTDENPVHIFSEVGRFLVSFSYTTEQGCTSTGYYVQTKTGTLQHADFIKLAPDTVCASTEVMFLDKSQDSSLVNEWYWRFGDGSYSLKKNPVHVYTDTGYMQVKLQSYYNGCGDAETKTKFIYVKGPFAKLTYKTECNNPYLALFNSNTIDADSVYWNFGDGTPIDSLQFNPSHLYTDNITYKAVLIAVNTSNKCKFTSEKEISIKDIRADFILKQNIGCENLKVELNSKSSQDVYYSDYFELISRYYWDFGDGTTLATNKDEISHQYIKKGTYPLKLTVSDFRGCRDSLIQIVKIFKPEPEFMVTDLEGCKPLTALFGNETPLDTTITSWLWNFGDGSSSSDQDPIHTYDQFGLFNVSLSATDILGCTGSVMQEGLIRVRKPIPQFSVSDNTICFGDSILFIPYDTTGVVSIYWDFGDGTDSNETFPKHLYQSPGKYTVSLSLIDGQGCDSTITKIDFIYIQNIPSPDITSNLNNSDCYPIQVNFFDHTENPDVIDWLWNFGDGQTSSHLKNPIHIYTAPGDYDISLRVFTANGCTSEILKKDFIDIKGPYALINAPDTVCRNENTLFIAENQFDVFELQWIFGDGNTSTTDSAIHAYNTIGYVYPVLLLQSDSLGTCDIYISDSIYIPQLIPEILVEDNLVTGCIPFEFNALNECSEADLYSWNFDDGTFDYNNPVSHTFVNSGTYQVKLIISNDFGCSDSSTVDLEAFALPHVEALEDTLICVGDQLVLTASGAEHYQWYPFLYLEDENADQPITIPDSTITYTVYGTDVNACVNTSSVKITVQQKPVVSLTDTAVIIGEQVILDAFSEGILNWLWYPDDSISCMDCPVVTVNPLEPTQYEITVTDTSNCFTLTYTVFIDIIKEYTLDVPNAFTPNGDGINDIVYVRGWGIDELITFKIVNRFGEIVFETNDKFTGWDGTYKGKMQGIESYTYFVSVKTYENQMISKKGSIKLLK